MRQVFVHRENYLAMVVFKHRRTFDEVQTTIQITESSLSTRIWCQTKAKKNSALANMQCSHQFQSSTTPAIQTIFPLNFGRKFVETMKVPYGSKIFITQISQ